MSPGTVRARAVAALLAVALAAGLAACGGDSSTSTSTRRAAVRSSYDIGGRTPFAASSPWNRAVDTQPVDPDSTRMLQLAAQSPLSTRDDAPPGSRSTSRNLYINLTGWAPAVHRVGSGGTVRMVCRQERCGRAVDAVPSRLRLPADATPDPAHDGWLVLVDEQRRVMWDLWRARRAGSTISYAFARRWSLTSTGVGMPPTARAPRTPSVRGSGLPLLAGLIRPRELRAGRIPHALAIALPGPAAARFVLPASTTNGLSSASSVPEGARLRLRPEALSRIQRARDQAPGAVTVAQALYTYGAIVVDRADAPTLYAQRNADYRGVLAANALGDLHLSDFQVLPLTRRLLDVDAPPEAAR